MDPRKWFVFFLMLAFLAGIVGAQTEEPYGRGISTIAETPGSERDEVSGITEFKVIGEYTDEDGTTWIKVEFLDGTVAWTTDEIEFADNGTEHVRQYGDQCSATPVLAETDLVSLQPYLTFQDITLNKRDGFTLYFAGKQTKFKREFSGNVVKIPRFWVSRHLLTEKIWDDTYAWTLIGLCEELDPTFASMKKLR